MELLVLAAGASVLLAIGFVAAPLLRSEDDIKPFCRARPGIRYLYGPPEDDRPDSDSRPQPVIEDGLIRCHHCGAVTDANYRYCEECLEPHERRSRA